MFRLNRVLYYGGLVTSWRKMSRSAHGVYQDVPMILSVETVWRLHIAEQKLVKRQARSVERAENHYHRMAQNGGDGVSSSTWSGIEQTLMEGSGGSNGG